MKKRRVREILKEYHIVSLALISVALGCIYIKVCRDMEYALTGMGQIKEMAEKVMDIVFSAIWLAITIIVLLQIKYKKITGRNYIWDRLQYQRNYIELIEYFKDADKHVVSRGALDIKEWRDSDGIILGRIGNKLIDIPPSAGKNIALFGIPKSGKTVTIISTCRQYGGSVFAIDIKGDIWKNTRDYRRIKIFSPSNPEISLNYDPLGIVRNKNIDDERVCLMNMALILLPDAGGSDGNGRYFIQGGRNFFMGVCLHLLHENAETSFSDIVETILLSDGITMTKKILKEGNLVSKQYVASFFGQNEKNIAGCWAALVDAMRPFNSEVLKKLLSGKGECISVESLEQGNDVYLQVQQSELEVYSPLLALITQQFINKFKERPEGAQRPILMILDEFAQLRKLPAIDVALATLRSKNVTVMLAMQSVAQIDKWYGEAGRKEIIDCCACVAFLKIQDADTRKWASDFVGTRKVLTRSYSDGGIKGRTKSNNEAREKIFQPEDFGDLGQDKILVCDGGKYILADIVKYYE